MSAPQVAAVSGVVSVALISVGLGMGAVLLARRPVILPAPPRTREERARLLRALEDVS